MFWESRSDVPKVEKLKVWQPSIIDNSSQRTACLSKAYFSLETEKWWKIREKSTMASI